MNSSSNRQKFSGKQMKIYEKILFAISLLNLLQSCQDETLKPKQSLNETSVENGRLSFKDTKTYFETIST